MIIQHCRQTEINVLKDLIDQAIGKHLKHSGNKHSNRDEKCTVPYFIFNKQK